MGELDNVKSKIKKLLAVGAKGSGATEEEASTAMKMAAAIMTKYGIERDAVATKKEQEINRARWGAINRKPLQTYQMTLAMAAGVLYGAEAAFYDIARNKCTGFVYVGREENIDAAEQTLLWLVRQVDELYRAARPSGIFSASKSTGYTFMNNFRQAAADRVYWRAKELIANPQLMATATGQGALVVQGYFEKLAKENKAVAAGQITQSKGRVIKHGYGSSEGDAAGRKVKLHQELGAGA